MIRFIAAIDSKRGIADEHGLPWQGKVPTDVHYYRNKIKKGYILMGFGLYVELSRPYENEHKINYVAMRGVHEKLREGFVAVSDGREFLKTCKTDVWNTGGALLFKSTMDLAEELHLTRLTGDFNCTKFFPEFERDFKLVSKSEPITENAITYHFEVWRRNQA